MFAHVWLSSQRPHKPFVPTGQLGNSGGPAWGLQQCPGAAETGGLHAKEEEVAHERLA